MDYDFTYRNRWVVVFGPSSRYRPIEDLPQIYPKLTPIYREYVRPEEHQCLSVFFEEASLLPILFEDEDEASAYLSTLFEASVEITAMQFYLPEGNWIVCNFIATLETGKEAFFIYIAPIAPQTYHVYERTDRIFRFEIPQH